MSQQISARSTFSNSELVTVHCVLLHSSLGTVWPVRTKLKTYVLGSVPLILTEEKEFTICVIAAWQVSSERNVSYKTVSYMYACFWLTLVTRNLNCIQTTHAGTSMHAVRN